MSACSVQAMSHVGCRLIVASSANSSRPFAPGACGDIARALATKAAMSSEADGFVSGTEPDLPDAGFDAAIASADFGLVGSRDMDCSQVVASVCGARWRAGQCAGIRMSVVVVSF